MRKGGRHLAGACDCSAQRNGRVFIAEGPAADLDGAALEYDGARALIGAIAGGGHAFQAHIVAETAGRVIHVELPSGAEASVEPGNDVAAEQQLATILVHAADRRAALR